MTGIAVIKGTRCFMWDHEVWTAERIGLCAQGKKQHLRKGLRGFTLPHLAPQSLAMHVIIMVKYICEYPCKQRKADTDTLNEVTWEGNYTNKLHLSGVPMCAYN